MILPRYKEILLVFLIALETNVDTSSPDPDQNVFSNPWDYLYSILRCWMFDIMDVESIVEKIVDVLPDTTLQVIGMYLRLHPFVDYNRTSFDIVIRQELFGQLMFDLNVPKILDDFFHKDVQKKTLLMSFHGSSGCGKSHAAKIIAENLFQDMDSKCVHLFYGIRDFYNENKKETYRKKIVTDVRRMLYKCEHQLFIFDDLDNMAPGVIDALMPYIISENEAAFRGKSIFLFLSNSGAEKINKIAVDAWLEFIPRENLILEMFTAHLKEAAYNEKGGLQYSNIVKENLIDVFIPFLPMEREQVIECIDKQRKLLKKPYDTVLMKKIAETFDYYPEQLQIFSRSGCKGVLFKIGFYYN